MYLRKVTAKDFLEHTAPAVRALFQAIAKEEVRYKPIQELLEGAHKLHYFDFISADLTDDFDASQVQHKFVKAAEAKMQALLISQSLEVLCGAVFQIGKQGISLILENAVDPLSKGRLVGSQNLAKLIWYGRIQAMHWEEGIPTQKKLRFVLKYLKKSLDHNLNSVLSLEIWHGIYGP